MRCGCCVTAATSFREVSKVVEGFADFGNDYEEVGNEESHGMKERAADDPLTSAQHLNLDRGEGEQRDCSMRTEFTLDNAAVRVFYRNPKNVRRVSHGDDFTVLGTSKSLGWFREAILERKLKLKERLGRERNRGSSAKRTRGTRRSY